MMPGPKYLTKLKSFFGSYTVYIPNIRYHRTISQIYTQKKDLEMEHWTRPEFQPTEKEVISW